MPGTLLVSDIDDDLIVRLNRRAAQHGRSAEAEHREVLRQALAADTVPTFDDLAVPLRALTAGRAQTPAEILLREAREGR